MARSPCRAASDHGGVLLFHLQMQNRNAEPNKTATARMRKAAISMTGQTLPHISL